jgi:hypothetical protein
MEQNIDNEYQHKNMFFTFYSKNKLKVYLVLGFIISIIFSIFLLQINEDRKNNMIAEKYVLAGQILANNNNEEAKKLFKEIIEDKNKFYSVLALNSILEKNLESDTNKVLEYFDVINQISKSQEQRDLITFKKALFLIKISKVEDGNFLLKKLIDDNSKLKSIAEETKSK